MIRKNDGVGYAPHESDDVERGGVVGVAEEFHQRVDDAGGDL
jgi:hypothetical protein